MKQEKFNRILGAASIAIILGITSTTAAAAPTSCPSTGENDDGISLNDVTYGVNDATSCYGVVSGNINQNDASAINARNWGGNDWMYLDATDSSGAAYQGISFTVTATSGTEGTWKLTAVDSNGIGNPLDLPATFDLAVALKGGNKYALWYYNDVPVNLTNDGKWEIEFKNNGGKHPDLSHMVIFGREGYNTPTSTVPVPAAAWLLGSGLIGLAGIARRKS